MTKVSLTKSLEQARIDLAIAEENQDNDAIRVLKIRISILESLTNFIKKRSE